MSWGYGSRLRWVLLQSSGTTPVSGLAEHSSFCLAHGNAILWQPSACSLTMLGCRALVPFQPGHCAGVREGAASLSAVILEHPCDGGHLLPPAHHSRALKGNESPYHTVCDQILFQCSVLLPFSLSFMLTGPRWEITAENPPRLG